MVIKKISIVIQLILVMALLNGCSSMNSDFDCPMKPGVRCESIDKVNARVDRGELGNVSAPNYSKTTSTELHETPSSQHSELFFTENENAMRIWIAPFTDKQGNYHEGNNVYVNQNTSEWI